MFFTISLKKYFYEMDYTFLYLLSREFRTEIAFSAVLMVNYWDYFPSCPEKLLRYIELFVPWLKMTHIPLSAFFFFLLAFLSAFQTSFLCQLSLFLCQGFHLLICCVILRILRQGKAWGVTVTPTIKLHKLCACFPCGFLLWVFTNALDSLNTWNMNCG